MENGSNRKGMTRFFAITGFIVLSVTILWGIHYFGSNEIRVVKAKHENGVDKEVWVYKRNIFGKKKKIREMTYFDNGNKESQVDYKHRKVNGWARMWYKDGKLHMEATYSNGKTHGVRLAYHKNGRLFCRAEYENGELLKDENGKYKKKNWDEEGNEIYLPIDRE
jgi:antitoxin component YwqK of YwqJK toxin-antitoxin module